MKSIIMVCTIYVIALSSISYAEPDLLTGDVRLACEATLCLAASTRPGECDPSLDKYFSIRKKKISKTLKARLEFLDLCPIGDGGVTTQRVQDVFGRCGLGYESVDCAQLGFGQDAAGFCTAYSGKYCSNFIKSKYLNTNSDVAMKGTYGLCKKSVNQFGYGQAYSSSPFAGGNSGKSPFSNYNNNDCSNFVAATPDDFGSAAAAKQLAKIQAELKQQLQ